MGKLIQVIVTYFRHAAEPTYKREVRRGLYLSTFTLKFPRS
jgi:hypothetical protein